MRIRAGAVNFARPYQTMGLAKTAKIYSLEGKWDSAFLLLDISWVDSRWAEQRPGNVQSFLGLE